MKISILYGTETGNAEMLAEDIMAELENEHTVACINLSDIAPGELDAESLHIVVCSTYGDGELPASAQPFAAKLEVEKPDLSSIRFAIFGLGDTEYDETFNFGPKHLSDLLQGRGALQVGQRIAHDASSADLAEDLAFPWVEAVLDEVAAKKDKV